MTINNKLAGNILVCVCMFIFLINRFLALVGFYKFKSTSLGLGHLGIKLDEAAA